MPPKKIPMPRYTLQEAFDLALVKVYEQGQPSMACTPVTNVPVCAYRGADNCRCAIGWLIPDERYNPGIEGYGVRVLRVRDGDVTAQETGFRLVLPQAKLPKVTLEHLTRRACNTGQSKVWRAEHGAEFLMDLQRAHDGAGTWNGREPNAADVAAFRKDFLEYMRQIAEWYALDTTVLDGLPAT